MLNKLRLAAVTLLLALSVSPAWAVLDDLHLWSTTAASNTDVGGVSIAEGMAPSGVNNAMREMMAELRRGAANKGTDIASAATTNICATGTSIYVDITGTTTITSFGTANAGCWRILQFDGALTLTHNATSLILPSGANITTAAGDVLGIISEGSGNWRAIFYSRVPYLSVANTFTAAQTITSTAAGTILTTTSTDAGAAAGPTYDNYRNSATPANNDVLGEIIVNGNDSLGNKTRYGAIYGTATDVTDGSEDGGLQLESLQAGVARTFSLFGGSLHYATLGQKGAGEINATGLYVNGHGTVAQFVEAETAAYSTAGTILPVDDTIPQNTEGDEILTVAITPTNASSTLKIEVDVAVQLNVAAGVFACAVFVDTTANAIAARAGTVATTDKPETLIFVHTLSAASTSARTYKVRCGSATATDLKINGDNSTRLFGGVMASSLTVTEVLPQ